MNTENATPIEKNPQVDRQVKPERIERKPTGELVLHLAGNDKPIEDVRIARCFPWSIPECYISIRGPDGKEIVLLRRIDDLDQASRRIVQEELTDKVFNPRIRAILEYKREFDIIRIKASTDRGEVIFQIRTRDDVRIISDSRALFRDVDGNTYELEDVNQLDSASRKHLREFF